MKQVKTCLCLLNKLKIVNEIYGFNILNKNGNDISPGKSLALALKNSVFKKYLLDNVLYGIKSYTKIYKKEDFKDGFIRYQKYSRKDCFRILNWEVQPLAQSAGVVTTYAGSTRGYQN